MPMTHRLWAFCEHATSMRLMVKLFELFELHSVGREATSLNKKSWTQWSFAISEGPKNRSKCKSIRFLERNSFKKVAFLKKLLERFSLKGFRIENFDWTSLWAKVQQKIDKIVNFFQVFHFLVRRKCLERERERERERNLNWDLEIHN